MTSEKTVVPGLQRVGVQLEPQATTMDALREAAVASEEAGFDSVWTWDHFFPLHGDPDAAHFEGWTLLTAFAADTTRVQLGHLVSCMSYRNPHLLADMARTVDHISRGRLVLGLGAGWFERDYTAYEYPFGTPQGRLRDLEAGLYRLRLRLRQLNPPPVGPLPLLIGGGGERITLRLVAENAGMWNGFGPPESFAHKNAVLDRWCAEVGRDPASIERSALVRIDEFTDGPGSLEDTIDAYARAGVQHLMLNVGHPFHLDAAVRVLDAVRARG